VSTLVGVPDTIDQMWSDIDDSEGKTHLTCIYCEGDQPLGAEVKTLCGLIRKVISKTQTSSVKCEACVVRRSQHQGGKCGSRS